MTSKLKLENKHVMAILIDNEFGALAKVVGLFSARGYNIETLTVAEIDKQRKLSRITITTYGSQETVDLIMKLVQRLVPVHKVVDLTKAAHVERGLALVKVAYNKENRDDLVRIAESQEATLIEREVDYFIFEITDESRHIDNFITLLEPFGIIEQSRSGSAAVGIGRNKLVVE
jgi:acetolactate synthase I/III small subunit